MAVLTVLTHPRSTLRAETARPRPRHGAAIVTVSGVACLVVDLGAALLTGGERGAIALSVAAPILLLAFWFASALLVGGGARLMGWAPRRGELLAVSALSYPVLVGYALIGLLQAASPHLGGTILSTAVGLLALPLICWFVTLNVIAAIAVYDASPMAATAIALLPYAALSAVLLLLVLVLSGLHAAGAV